MDIVKGIYQDTNFYSQILVNSVTNIITKSEQKY
jgi:hypothetical protein